jgi:hypothetical protein
MNDSELQTYSLERTEGFRMAVNNEDFDAAMDQFDKVERDLTHDQAASVWALMAGELVFLFHEADRFTEADRALLEEIFQPLAPLFRLYEEHGRSGEFFDLLRGELAEQTGDERRLMHEDFVAWAMSRPTESDRSEIALEFASAAIVADKIGNGREDAPTTADGDASTSQREEFMDDGELQTYGFERSERLRLVVNTGDVLAAVEQFDMSGDIERGLSGEQAARIWVLMAGELVCYVYDVDWAEIAIGLDDSLAPLFQLYEEHGRTGEFFSLLASELAALTGLERERISSSLCSAATAAADDLSGRDSEDVSDSAEEDATLEEATETAAAPGTIRASDGSTLRWDETRQAYVDASGEEWVVQNGQLIKKWYWESINAPLSPRDQRRAQRDQKRREKQIRRKLGF